jgi:hypothetical protein
MAGLGRHLPMTGLSTQSQPLSDLLASRQGFLFNGGSIDGLLQLGVMHNAHGVGHGQVGMAIDEAGYHRLPSGIDALARFALRRSPPPHRRSPAAGHPWSREDEVQNGQHKGRTGIGALVVPEI